MLHQRHFTRGDAIVEMFITDSYDNTQLPIPVDVADKVFTTTITHFTSFPSHTHQRDVAYFMHDMVIDLGYYHIDCGARYTTLSYSSITMTSWI